MSTVRALLITLSLAAALALACWGVAWGVNALVGVVPAAPKEDAWPEKAAIFRKAHDDLMRVLRACEGDPREVQLLAEMKRQLTSLRARCVAEMGVPPERLPPP